MTKILCEKEKWDKAYNYAVNGFFTDAYKTLESNRLEKYGYSEPASQGGAVAEILNELKIWAIGRYDYEVANRPDVNIYKTTLRATWMQIINKIEEMEKATASL